MIIYYPESLFARAVLTERSRMWLDAAGWSRNRAYVVPLAGSRHSELIPDIFISRDKRGWGRNPVFHGKLPKVKTYSSLSSIRFWARENHLWDGYDVFNNQNLNTNMYKSFDNGICNAQYIHYFESMNSVIWCISEPHGLLGDSWHIPSITYYEWAKQDPPGWYYKTRLRYYQVFPTDTYPLILLSNYDPAVVDRVARQNFNPESFGPWDPYQEPWQFPELSYTEYSKPNFSRTLFEEDRRINGIPTSYHQYEFDWLIQHAFYDACQGIGKANDNTIKNIIEILSDVAGIVESLGGDSPELVSDVMKQSARRKSLKQRLKDKIPSHDLVQVAETSSSSWLGYRYAYSTSMMDYKQYVAYINHKMDTYMNFLNVNFHERVFGTSEYVIDGVSIKCICELAYRPRTYEGLKSLCRYVHDAGLEVNPYVLWDMVPYSFVVDWALPLGDVFDVISNQKYYSSEYYEFEFVGFSISYDLGEEGRRYYRWYQDPPPLESFYWFDKGDKHVSGKLILKRTLDGIALVIG